MSNIATPNTAILGLTADIVSAHVGNNAVPTDALSALIQSVFMALSTVETGSAPEASRPQPALPVRKSVFPDYIVCLEDGKRLKMLKRHLNNAYALTPDQYRARWGLPRDYPMVAPNYAARRSTLAKQIGLGRKLGENAEATETIDMPTARRRGRPKRQAA